MTPEKQRIAIAEACGWKQDWRNVGANHEKVEVWLDPDLGVWTTRLNDGWFPMPDYVNDRNAMANAEKSLLDNQELINQNFENLVLIVSGKPVTTFRHGTKEEFFSLLLAVSGSTAAQRAEAFLRTIGKWETTD